MSFLLGVGDVIMFCDRPTKWPMANKNLQNKYINIQSGGERGGGGGTKKNHQIL